MVARETPLERVRKKRWLAGRRSRRNRTILIGVVLTALGVGLAVAALPIFILFYGGLLPTLVAYLADEQPGRYLFRTVGFMNLAAIIPYIEGAWYAGNHAMLTGDLANFTTWLVIYIAAAAGYGIYFMAPWITSFVLEVMIRSRIARSREERETVNREWEFDSR